MNENLNQQKIINSNDNLLIIASAGCGKTYTINKKIKKLLKNINPEEILVLSFTNETVNDLKNKLPKNINVFTFHKLAINILNNTNYNYKLNNESDLEYIINEFFYSVDNKYLKSLIKKYFFILKYENLFTHSCFTEFKNTILSFMKKMKAYDYNNLFFFENIKTTKDKTLLTIIACIYQVYTIEKKAVNSIDLDDLISIASKKAKDIKFNYKYIFVDEFQDSSLIRFNLIYNIFKNSEAKINFFGDDYQSIYAFSGCNLDIMLNIKSFIQDIKFQYLDKNYRSDNHLIITANKFIMKNKNQLLKTVSSNIFIDNSINFIYYTNLYDSFTTITTTLNSSNILVLGRYKSDLKAFNDYRCLTIHEAKGLEEDYVMIVNFKNATYGFPSKIKDNKILDVFKTNENIKYAEERRLCYVAITRAKIKTFIFIPYHNKSIFTKELETIYKNIKKNN